jgi:protoporphyrinogen oxidase
MEGELVEVHRVSRIYFDGRYFDYPISVGNVLKNAGLVASAHAAASYLWSAGRELARRRPPANMKEAYVAQFGEKLYEMFFRRYSEKVWGRRCEELSADWVAQRSKGLSVLVALKDALTKKRDVVSLIDRFVYPRLGYQRICERMAEDVRAAGSRVHLGARVEGVTHHGPNDLTVRYASPDGPRSVRATNVISTIPVSVLTRIVEPPCAPEVAEAASSMEFRDLITVTVMLRKPEVTRDTWLYVHDDLVFARLHEPKNWSPDMVPGPEFTSLVCECFCTFGDETWRKTDAELTERVISDLADRLRFIGRDEVIGTYVARRRFVYPVYDLGYRSRLDRIYSFINRLPGLHIVGRGGTFRYNNADHSIEMGLLLAKRILGEERDPMSVNTEQEYQEEIRRAQGAPAAR